MKAVLENNQYVLDEFDEKDLFGNNSSKYKILTYFVEGNLVPCSLIDDKDRYFVLISDEFDESGTVSKNQITIQQLLDKCFGEGPSERSWRGITKQMLYKMDKRKIRLVKAMDFLEQELNKLY